MLPPLPAHARWVLDGDSITSFAWASTGLRSWVRWGSMLSGAPLYIPPGGNLATSGQGVDDVLGRIVTAMGLSPAIYSILIGTNDGSKTQSQLEDALWGAAGHAEPTIYGGPLSIGARLNVIPILPKGQTVETRTAAMLATNANIRARAAADQRYIITDMEAVFNPRSAASPAQSGDGVHPLEYGAYLIGKEWARVMTPILPPFGSILPTTVTAENLCGNPLLTGTAGTKGGTNPPTGDVATGWNLGRASGDATIVASKGALANGAEAQVVQFSGGTSATAATLSRSVPFSGSQPDLFEAWLCVEVEGTGWQGARILCSGYFDSSTTGLANIESPNPGQPIVVRAIPIALSGAPGAANVGIAIYATVGANLTVKFGQVMVRKVPA
ncbi:SGNH/GDSL hydrolase family protein [Bosea sp. (in: a-proteobacteria)]|uniref:SGNH/GDSL hydrolase family protein n=1 Tax=Bosea sp. (in: a-proteobacteria) TaxID=1871050 RepID=UPI0026047C5C|nr:SGNH/GDSL hydrolase family protein [Bosea sp. (in: a-proteobacteria)]MCO5092655.1 SGNH/GDSL hydrolase family protein [Bosea sp. (in: a-proteobacteria)]